MPGPAGETPVSTRASSWLQEDLIIAVRDALVARDWTQARLAREAGMTQKHVSELLTGSAQGSLDAWAILLHAALNAGGGRYPVARVTVKRKPPARLL